MACNFPSLSLPKQILSMAMLPCSIVQATFSAVCDVEFVSAPSEIQITLFLASGYLTADSLSWSQARASASNSAVSPDASIPLVARQKFSTTLEMGIVRLASEENVIRPIWVL